MNPLVDSSGRLDLKVSFGVFPDPANMESLASSAEDFDALLEGFEPLPVEILRPSDVFDHQATSEVVAVEAITYKSSSSPFSSVSSTSSSSNSSINSSKSRDLVAERRARHRARSKNEVKYLREVVGELERQLEDWKASRSSSSRNATLLAPSTQSKVWKALAMRQKLGRKQSEAENVRLRELLDNQLKFAMQLQHLISLRENGAERVPSALSIPRVAIDEADADLLETFLDELDTVYAYTDDVFRETGADLRPETTHRIIRMCRRARENPTPGSGAGDFIELLDTHMMQSDLETARKNTWDFIMHMYLRRSGMQYSPAGSHPNAVLLKFRFPYKWLGRDSSVTIVHAFKTFDEPDRQVNVCRAMYIGEGGLSGMATQETGWSVLSPSTTDSNRTICRCVSRESSMRFHRPASDAPEQAPPQLAEFVRVVLEKGDEDFGAMLNEISKLSIRSSS